MSRKDPGVGNRQNTTPNRAVARPAGAGAGSATSPVAQASSWRAASFPLRRGRNGAIAAPTWSAAWASPVLRSSAGPRRSPPRLRPPRSSSPAARSVATSWRHRRGIRYAQAGRVVGVGAGTLAGAGTGALIGSAIGSVVPCAGHRRRRGCWRHRRRHRRIHWLVLVAHRRK